MRLVSLAEVPNYSDKELLPSVRGRILKVGKLATGNGNYGPWSLQDIEIEGDGMRFTVVVDGHEELPSNLEGRFAEFSCSDGEKGPSGVYAHNDKKKNNLRKIKVTKTGNIDLIDESGAPAPQTTKPTQTAPPPHQRTDAPPPQTHSNTATASRPKPGSDDDIKEAKRQITQCANLMLLCQICVEKIVVPGYKLEIGKDMDEVRKSALATSLYISVERKGANNLMPTHPLFDTKPAQTAPPAEPPPEKKSW